MTKIYFVGGDFNGHLERLDAGYKRVHGEWGLKTEIMKENHCYKLLLLLI